MTLGRGARLDGEDKEKSVARTTLRALGSAWNCVASERAAGDGLCGMHCASERPVRKCNVWFGEVSCLREICG